MVLMWEREEWLDDFVEGGWARFRCPLPDPPPIPIDVLTVGLSGGWGGREEDEFFGGRPKCGFEVEVALKSLGGPDGKAE